jgi:hypothetical protein
MIKVSDLPLNGLQNTRPASNHERDNRDERLSFNDAFLYCAAYCLNNIGAFYLPPIFGYGILGIFHRICN